MRYESGNESDFGENLTCYQFSQDSHQTLSAAHTGYQGSNYTATLITGGTGTYSGHSNATMNKTLNQSTTATLDQQGTYGSTGWNESLVCSSLNDVGTYMQTATSASSWTGAMTGTDNSSLTSSETWNQLQQEQGNISSGTFSLTSYSLSGSDHVVDKSLETGNYSGSQYTFNTTETRTDTVYELGSYSGNNFSFSSFSHQKVSQISITDSLGTIAASWQGIETNSTTGSGHTGTLSDSSVNTYTDRGSTYTTSMSSTNTSTALTDEEGEFQGNLSNGFSGNGSAGGSAYSGNDNNTSGGLDASGSGLSGTGINDNDNFGEDRTFWNSSGDVSTSPGVVDSTNPTLNGDRSLLQNLAYGEPNGQGTNGPQGVNGGANNQGPFGQSISDANSRANPSSSLSVYNRGTLQERIDFLKSTTYEQFRSREIISINSNGCNRFPDTSQLIIFRDL